MATDDAQSAADTHPLTTAREYLHVQPTKDTPTPERLEQTITTLHAMADEGGFLSLGSSDGPPTIEVLLVASGRTGPTGDRSLDYYLGIENGSLDDLQDIFGRAFPHSYDRRQTTVTPADALGLPLDLEATDGASLGNWGVAGVEYRGIGERYDDWQLRLTPADEFTPAVGSAPNWPLDSITNAFATTDAPAIFQVLIQPKPDWSTAANVRISELREDRDTIWGELQYQIWGALNNWTMAMNRSRRTPSESPRSRRKTPAGRLRSTPAPSRSGPNRSRPNASCSAVSRRLAR